MTEHRAADAGHTAGAGRTADAGHTAGAGQLAGLAGLTGLRADLAGQPADLASLAAGLGAQLRAEGVPVGPDQCARFARAVQLAAPATNRQLYLCALATLVADPADIPVLERVFDRLFLVDHELASMIADRSGPAPHDQQRGTSEAGGDRVPDPRAGPRPGAEPGHPSLAAEAERLAYRDFGDLTEAELAALALLMRRLRLATPPRRSRRMRVGDRGRAVSLRATLRQARRTAGHPVRLRRRSPRLRPRRLVVLCDISGSMAPYARAMLQLLYGAAGGHRGEVFTFATRLTRLTRSLRRVRPEVALARAGHLAPDWSGGTRIGVALREFLDRYGARGMARGAVVVIVSDGWDSGDPAVLGQQMGRLARLAYRIVWVNPRAASPRFRPLAGGMAAAWPFCDAVVSGHHLAALDDLLAALAAPTRAPGRRREVSPAARGARHA